MKEKEELKKAVSWQEEMERWQNKFMDGKWVPLPAFTQLINNDDGMMFLPKEDEGKGLAIIPHDGSIIIQFISLKTVDDMKFVKFINHRKPNLQSPQTIENLVYTIKKGFLGENENLKNKEFPYIG